MSVIANGVITQTSVSQIESFDDEAKGGCNRKWWFNIVKDLKPEKQETAQSDGDFGHALLAHYLKTGESPKRRVKMGKAVTGAIVKGDLPAPGPDLLVEERFDGQEKYDVNGHWLPLDKGNTLWLADVPLEGFIDLTYRRGDIPTILDHKFSSDIDLYSKKPSELIKTVQMPVYVLSQMPFWPDAKMWELVHHYVSRTGVTSKMVSKIVTAEQVLERKVAIEKTIEKMKIFARVEKQDDVPANTKGRLGERACDMWNGCPHQSICTAFKKGAPKMEMSPEEMEMFESLDGIGIDDAPPVTPAPVNLPVVESMEKPKRRMLIQDVPSPATEVAATVKCACSATITAENGSRLQDGTWRHIGCPLDAPPVAAPKARRAKPEAAKPAEPVSVPPPAAVITFPAGVTSLPGPLKISGNVVVVAGAPEPTKAPWPELPLSKPLADAACLAPKGVEWEGISRAAAGLVRAEAIASVLRSIANLIESQ